MSGEESDGQQISDYFVFREVEYLVTLEVQDTELTIEVQDKGTTDQWRNTFHTNYIEEMTKKTGNFKKFSVFSSMIESAISKKTDSVSLDLLSYEDLKELRNRKIGTVDSEPDSVHSKQLLDSRRYLIITYCVEFDRVCYPLILPYMGKPDPRNLQQTILKLKSEIKALQKQILRDYRSKELKRLRKEFEKMAREKEEVETALSECQRELETTTEATTNKQINILRNIIKNLQEELLAESSRHKRMEQKQTQLYRKTVDELEEVKASERNLRTRIRSLTSELMQYKRKHDNFIQPSGTMRMNSNRPNSTPSGRSLEEQRSRSLRRSLSSNQSQSSSLPPRDGSLSQCSRSSRDRYSSQNSRDRSLQSNQMVRNRSSSQNSQLIRSRSLSQNSRRIRERSLSQDGRTARDRGRSTSADRVMTRTGSRGFVSSRKSSVDRYLSRSKTVLSRSPSPVVVSRFDPTAYEAERRRRLKEIELKRKREIKGGMSAISAERSSRRSSPAISLHGTSSHVSSIGSTASLRSSMESLSEIERVSTASLRNLLNGSVDSVHPKEVPNGTVHPLLPVKERVDYSKRIVNARTSTPTDSIADCKVMNSKGTSEYKEYVHSKGKPVDSEVSQGLNSSITRSSELSDIDARLTRLQEFMKANLS